MAHTPHDIASIVYKPQHVDFTPPDGYSRIPVEQIKLVEGYGIEGDRKGGNPQRQLNIMSAETLGALSAEGFKTTPGHMGEQIVLRGIDVDNLPAGTRLQLGDTACVEIIKQRTGCERFERIQGKSRHDAAGRMGVLAAVITSGVIRVGEPVQVLQPDETQV